MTLPVGPTINPPPTPPAEKPGDAAIKTGAKKTPKPPAKPEQPREYVTLASVCRKELSLIDHSTWWGTAKKTCAVVIWCLFVIPFSVLFEPFHAAIHYGLKSKTCCTPLNPDRKRKPPSKSKEETENAEKDKTKPPKKHRGTLPELEGINPPTLPEPVAKSEENEDATKTEDASELTEEEQQKKMQEAQAEQMKGVLKPIASTIGCTEEDLLELGKMVQESLTSPKEQVMSFAVWLASFYDPTGWAMDAYALAWHAMNMRKISNKKLAVAYAGSALTLKYILLGYFGLTGMTGLGTLAYGGYKSGIIHRSKITKIAAALGTGALGFGAKRALQFISPAVGASLGVTGTLGLATMGYGVYKLYQAGLIGELYQAGMAKVRSKMGWAEPAPTEQFDFDTL